MKILTVAALGLLCAGVAACDETTMAAGPGASEAERLMTEARTVASRRNVDQATLEAATDRGRSLRSIRDSDRGRDLASACEDLGRAASIPRELQSLEAEDAETLAMCSGYFS
ncbi:hypothetical protein [Tranquillimonas rosea]|uniref:hypothetical protein n=1 Tax=Tranquillimonas rosea TaxID=641238 RepID=UPI003BA97244